MVLGFCYLNLHKAIGLCYGTVTSNSLQCPAYPIRVINADVLILLKLKDLIVLMYTFELYILIA